MIVEIRQKEKIRREKTEGEEEREDRRRRKGDRRQ